MRLLINSILFFNLCSLSLPPARATESTTNFIVCMNADNQPFSSAMNTGTNVDVQVADLVAKNMGRTLRVLWVEIPRRGGLSKAIKSTIGEGKCEAFIGLPTSELFAEELRENKLIISKPYFKIGYVLLFSKSKNIKSTSSLNASSTIGTVSGTSGDFHIHKNYAPNRRPYNNYDDLYFGLINDLIDYALVWSPSLAQHADKLSSTKFEVIEFEPENPALNSGLGVAMLAQNKSGLNLINNAIEQLINNGSLNLIMNQAQPSFLRLP